MADYVGLSDIVNSAAGIGNQFLEYTAQLEIEKAQSNLQKMKAQLSSDTNNFLLKLEMESDFQTYPRKLEEFMQEKRSGLKDKNSPYYATNDYTAKIADQMLNEQYESLQNKILFLSLGKVQNEITENNEETKKIIRNNPGLTSAQKIAEVGAITDSDFANGRIKDYSQYKAKRGNEASIEYLNSLEKNVDELIRQGSSWEDIQTFISKEPDTYELSILSEGTNPEAFKAGESSYTTMQLDTKEIKQSVLKSKLSDFNAHRQSIWDKNESKLSELYRKLETETDPEKKLEIAKQGLYLLGVYKPNKDLSNDTHTGWSRTFGAEIKSYETAKTKADKESDKDLKSFETYIKNFPEKALQEIADGTITDRYAAEDAIQILVKKEYFSGDWKETKGMTNEEKQKQYEEKYSSFGKTILDADEIKKALNSNPAFFTIKTKWEKFKKDFEEDSKKKSDKRTYTEDASRYIASFVYDLVASSGKNTDYEALSKQLDEQLNACTLTGLQKMFKGVNTIAEGVNTLENNDVVHTDINGAEQWVPGAKEKVDAIKNKQEQQLKAVLGIDKIDGITYTKVRNDTEPIPVFTVDKVDYTFVSDPKDKGNYIIKGSNGFTYDVKAEDKKRKQKDKEERKQRVKEVGKKYSENTQNADETLQSSFHKGARGRL